MISEKLFIIIAGIFGVLAGCKGQSNNPEQSSPDERFKTGQVWKYNNRAGEDSSTLTILKTEKYEKGDTIIHIRVDAVRMFNPNMATGYSDFIGHLPFSQKAISKSVTQLVGQNNNLPDFSEGYHQWKDAWDSGKGGYWTIDLKEAIEGVDSAMKKRNNLNPTN